jgi:hypothetical protein
MKSAQELAGEYRSLELHWIREPGIDGDILKGRLEAWIKDIQMDAVMAAAEQCVKWSDACDRVNDLALKIQSGKYPRP